MGRSDPLLLASASPRRADLLREAGIPFEVVAVASVDEHLPAGPGGRPVPVNEAVRMLALRKVRAAVPAYPGRLLLAADTLVSLGGEALGKPADPREAIAMLTALSGRVHEVATGVALAGPDAAGKHREESGVAVAKVVFRPLAAEEIRAYVASGEPLDKAGAYALQGGAAAFVSQLEGDPDTVIGLPLGLVRTLHDRFG